MKCPVGAHTRRTNPRDAFKDELIGVNLLHRIIRRSTAYGPPLPEGVLEDDGADRGIVFVCVGAHLKRQFEFLQTQWINAGTFFGAPDDWLFAKVILPILLLAAAPMGDVVRQTRVAVLGVLGQDYIRTAHAKGLHLRMIVVRHILRNALIPVVTSLGLIANALIHGSVFLDRMFSLPGFGSLVVNGIQLLDFPVILGTTIFSALIVIAANLITDVIYPFIDPRVRIE